MSDCTLLPRWGNNSPFPHISIALYLGKEIILYYYDYRLGLRTRYKNLNLWQRVSSFYHVGKRNWIIVSEISKEHSNFIFKNLEAGTCTTWKMKVLCSLKVAKTTVQVCDVIYLTNGNLKPCAVINMKTNNSLLNNQPEALIIQIYSVIKLYMFRASSLPIIRSFLLYIRQW